VACADGLLSISAMMVRPDETASAEDAVAALDLRVGQLLISDIGGATTDDRSCRSNSTETRGH
jgi:hypothetical protein